MLFDCTLYAPVREQFAELFAQEHTLQSFFAQDAGSLARFAAACRRAWEDATAVLAPLSPSPGDLGFVLYPPPGIVYTSVY